MVLEVVLRMLQPCGLDAAQLMFCSALTSLIMEWLAEKKMPASSGNCGRARQIAPSN